MITVISYKLTYRLNFTELLLLKLDHDTQHCIILDTLQVALCIFNSWFHYNLPPHTGSVHRYSYCLV